jgi:hypothetical protein
MTPVRAVRETVKREMPNDPVEPTIGLDSMICRNPVTTAGRSQDAH